MLEKNKKQQHELVKSSATVPESKPHLALGIAMLALSCLVVGTIVVQRYIQERGFSHASTGVPITTPIPGPTGQPISFELLPPASGPIKYPVPPFQVRQDLPGLASPVNWLANDGIALAWSLEPDPTHQVVGFYVSRAMSRSQDQQTVMTPYTRQFGYFDNTLIRGVPYTYTIRSFDAQGKVCSTAYGMQVELPLTNPVTFPKLPPISVAVFPATIPIVNPLLPMPGETRAEATTYSIIVRWLPPVDPNHQVVAFHVIRRNNNNPNDVRTISSWTQSMGIIDSLAVPGVAYTYWVRSVDALGEVSSAATSASGMIPVVAPPPVTTPVLPPIPPPVTVPLTMPSFPPTIDPKLPWIQNLAVRKNAATSYTLTWNMPYPTWMNYGSSVIQVQTCVGYYVERSDINYSNMRLMTNFTRNLNYTDSSAMKNKDYIYYVSCITPSGGVGPYLRNTTGPQLQPEKPYSYDYSLMPVTNFVTTPSKKGITLTWDAPLSAPIMPSGYHVERMLLDGSGISIVMSNFQAGKNVYVDTAAKPGLGYNYIVYPVNRGGQLGLSSDDYGTIPLTVARIVIQPKQATIKVNGKLQLYATAYDIGNRIVSETQMLWTVSPMTGGSISPAGLFTAGNKKGTVYVVATDLNTQVSGQIMVTIQ